MVSRKTANEEKIANWLSNEKLMRNRAHAIRLFVGIWQLQETLSPLKPENEKYKSSHKINTTSTKSNVNKVWAVIVAQTIYSEFQ